MIFPSACAPRLIDLQAAEPQETTAHIDWSDYGLVLSRVAAGYDVDYARLIDDPAPLDRFLAQAARIGPTRTPDAFATGAHRTAYYANCYNAMILRSVAELARNGRLPRRAPVDLDRRFAFRVDGRRATPADLRAAALRAAGDDWRVRFALCGGRRGDPPLPPRPLLGEMLDTQLALIVRTALAAPQIVTIDHVAKRLRLGRPLYEIKDRLLRDYERRVGTSQARFLSVLLDLADAEQRPRLNAAVGYPVEPLPFDDELNPPRPKEPPPRRSPLDVFSF